MHWSMIWYAFRSGTFAICGFIQGRKLEIFYFAVWPSGDLGPQSRDCASDVTFNIA